MEKIIITEEEKLKIRLAVIKRLSKKTFQNGESEKDISCLSTFTTKEFFEMAKKLYQEYPNSQVVLEVKEDWDQDYVKIKLSNRETTKPTEEEINTACELVEKNFLQFRELLLETVEREHEVQSTLDGLANKLPLGVRILLSEDVRRLKEKSIKINNVIERLLTYGE